MNRNLSGLMLALMAWPALAASPSVLFDRDVRVRAEALIAHVESGAHEQLVGEIKALASDPLLSAAQRDAAAWDLIRRMRRLAPDQVPVAVLDQLTRWVPQSFRPHQESPDWLMPLFDVSAAARGLQHQWAFADGVADAQGRGAQARIWSQRYRSDPRAPYARGVRSALITLSDWQLDKLIDLAAADPLLRDSLLPELWLAQGNLDAMSNWLLSAPDSRVNELLARASRESSSEAVVLLGQRLLAHPSDAVRALALARQTDAWLQLEAWPREWAEALWSQRADPALRSTAELQLIRIDAAARWRDDPASAPPGVIDSPEFDQLEALSTQLRRSAGGVQ